MFLLRQFFCEDSFTVPLPSISLHGWQQRKASEKLYLRQKKQGSKKERGKTPRVSVSPRPLPRPSISVVLSEYKGYRGDRYTLE